MNELTKHIQQILVPKAALIAYEYKPDSYSAEQHYLELRPINKEGKMGAGIPVTYKFMNILLESYTEQMSGVPHGRISSNMLWCDARKGHERYIWYNPPQKRQMYFSKSLAIPDGIFSMPGTIYVVSGNHLDVFAFKGEKPEENTKLYLAPYFNVSGSGVCLGSSSLEKPADPDFISLTEYWEIRFWLSEFSHLGSGGNPTHSNLVSVTEHARNHPFNIEELKPINKCLKDILQ
mgnify:CR=1 FL=1